MNSGQNNITLSQATISDSSAIEYQWVRTLYVEGYHADDINHYIHTCFGGDMVFADLFRKVALHEESVHVLIQHLGCPIHEDSPFAMAPSAD